MERILSGDDIYYLKEYQLEKDFEQDVVKNYRHIFGNDTIYIDIKKKIGDNIVTIPDGYLLDFTFPNNPRLYIIENELSVHDAYKHIGTQLLKFAVSYKQSRLKIKHYILDYLSKTPNDMTFIEKKASEMRYRNIDAMLETMIYRDTVDAIVIIDNSSVELENVLSHLSMKIDIIEFRAYENRTGNRIYKFIPFNNEVKEFVASRGDTKNVSPEEIDTIVVPAQEDGFQSAFIESNAWWQIRISVSMLDKIKYIAAYRTAPISAITHIAEVDHIEKYKDTNKYILYFKEHAKEIPHIELDKDKKGVAPQASRYTTYVRLMSATKLSEVF
ncbi:MAG: hypothetical protein E7079_00420 [Bacteroidales bacterium]|nr:hypothetical protein [Bacteroidales bacterium]